MIKIFSETYVFHNFIKGNNKLNAKSEPSKHLYLVDGSGYIFRAFHGLPFMSRSDGTPVNAVYGFTTMVLKLVEEAGDSPLMVVFDAARASFRTALYPAYKAHRPEPPEDLIPQFSLIRAAVQACSLPCIEMEGWEADDIIATYARQANEAGITVTILSSDKDMMQLVGPDITMFDPLKNRLIGPEQVQEKFGVKPEQVIDVQALAGDSADNVPGVPGIGIKTAAQLILEYGNLNRLLAAAQEIKQPKRRQSLLDYADQARLSQQLVTLRDDVPVQISLTELMPVSLDPMRLLDFLRDNEFKTILARMQARFAANSTDLVDAGRRLAGQTSMNMFAVMPEQVIIGPPDLTQYVLIQTKEQLQPWIEAAWDQGEVAIDTETDSLEACRANLVGISLALAPNRACYIPLRHVNHAGDLAFEAQPQQIPLNEAITQLRPLLESEAIIKIGQNIKYDWQVLARPENGGGVEMRNLDDTMLLSYVLDGGKHGHGMDKLSAEHLGHEPIPFKQVTGTGKEKITFDKVPLDQACHYAAEDADITWRLHRILKPRLWQEKRTSVYETLERPLITVLAQMERTGIKVDRQKLQHLSGVFGQRLALLEKQIHGLAGHPFTIGSPKQLSGVLYDEMGLHPGRKTKSGGRSTDSDALEPLAARGVEIAARILDWRMLAKLKSTYADALVAHIDETGRIHSSFAQAIASTGRLSSTDPNLQNIPIRTQEGRLIREAFIAEPGWKLLSADYSQVELRLVAHIAGIEFLRQAFYDGKDIHALTAAQIFDVPQEEMDPELRRRAKAINFGIIYGISGFGLSQQLGIGQKEASSYIRNYLDRLPELKEWLETCKQQARSQGKVETLFGRCVHIRAAQDANHAKRGGAERQAINAPIQGSAADIIKRAMIRIPPALQIAGLSARMLLQVHDELLFEVPEAELEESTTLIRQLMEQAALPLVSLSVPLVVDVGVGDSWAEAH